MKKIFIILLFSFFKQGLFCQPQRLAVLPATMQVAGGVSTLCIDYFREIPKATDNYKYIIKAAESDKSKLNSFSGKGTGNGTQLLLEGGRGGRTISNDNHFIVSASGYEEVPSYYSDFIDRTIQLYKSREFGEVERLNLQMEIWQFDILNSLNYIDHSIGIDIRAAYQRAQQHFKDDFFPNSFKIDFSDYEEVAGGLKTIGIQNKEVKGAYKIVMINKNSKSGKYMAFDGINSSIYSGIDERQLMAALGNKFSNNDNVYFLLSNFENGIKERAFIGSTKTKMSLLGKKVIIESLPESDQFFIPAVQKLARSLGEKDIVLENINSRDFYAAKIKFNCSYYSEGSQRTYHFSNEVKAVSNYKDLIRKFLGKINNSFQNNTRKVSLAYQLNILRKEVKNTLNLQSDAELWLQFKGDGEKTIWVNLLEKTNPDYYALK